MSPHPEQFLDRVVTNRTTFADILTRDLNDPVQYIRKALSVVAPTAGEQKTTQTASVGEHEKKITSEQLAEVKKQLRTHKIPTNMRKGDYFRAVLAEERILDQAATHLPRFEALWAMGEPKLKEQAKRCKTYRATQLAILQERLRLHQQAKEACLVRDPRQLLNADDVDLWLTKREASMKADETRRAKGKKSSAINPKRFEVGGSGETPLLLLPDVSAQRFKSRSIKSSRFPLKLHKKKITLVTCDGDQVVVSSASNARAKKVSLERLAHLRPHVQFQLVEYHFQAIGERKRFELTKKKRGGPYLGLRPADTDSPLGHDVRAGVRTAYDIMAGEVTYGPTTKLTQHIPVKATKTTTRLSNGAEVEEENEHGGDEGDDATGQDKGEDAGGVDVDVQEQKDGGDEDSDEKEKGFGGDGDNDGNQDDVDETKDGHTHALMQEYRDLFDKVCAKVASESDMAGSTALKNWKRKNRNSMIGRIEKQLRTRRRRAVREREMEQAFATAGTDPNSVSGLACGCQDHHGDNGCQKVSNPTHSSASVCDLHRHGSNSTRWRTGLEHIPEALRKWDPGLDPFGVPYLSITRHSDQDRRRLWARFGLRGGALSSRWQFGADPNIMSFYDLYLPATGCVIHVGQGWAQRVYNRYGVANDDCASKMDHLINEQLRKADWVTDAELKLAKLAITRRLETGTDRDARVYQECTRQIDENWAAIAKAQDRLHEVTCILMAAFEIRILPWMETDQMLQAKGGVFQLSKANKRKLSFLSHGKFRQRLIHHCGDPNHSSNRIVWVTEEYTSKLCGRCGCYCGYLRGSRTFKCPNEQCGQHVDRDGNAAKNIWTWGLLEALRRMDAEQTHAAASSASSNATSLPCNPPHGGLGATMASL